LCERLAGQDANVTTVPVAVLRFTRQLTRFSNGQMMWLIGWHFQRLPACPFCLVFCIRACET